MAHSAGPVSYTHLDQGYKSARTASIDAMSELGGAIVSITLVMMSVFVPVSLSLIHI